MVEKLLVQSKGSKNDPEFSDQIINLDGEDISFLDYFGKHRIRVLEAHVREDNGKIEKDLIISSPGNTPLCLDLAEDVRDLADQGERIVCVQQGGLYFAKPSLEAANMPTVPVISIPLDGGMWGGLDAMLAPQVPTGVPVIGGVGIARYDVAAKIAKEILTEEFKGVYLFNPTKKLEEKLKKLGIEVLGEANDSLKEGLVLGYIDESNYVYSKRLSTLDKIGTFAVFTPRKAPIVESGGKKKPMDNAHEAVNLMRDCCGLKQSIYVRGEENLAFFAAKIMSAYNPELKEKLYAEQKKKADSYAKRSITLDSFRKVE